MPEEIVHTQPVKKDAETEPKKEGAPAVPQHKSYGGGGRDEVGGGPAGRGNDGAAVVSTKEEWSRGKSDSEERGSPELDRADFGK